MSRDVKIDSLRPISQLVREQEEELERMIARDRRLLILVILILCVVSTVMWLG